jgi:hypothetical protein
MANDTLDPEQLIYEGTDQIHTVSIGRAPTGSAAF